MDCYSVPAQPLSLRPSTRIVVVCSPLAKRTSPSSFLASQHQQCYQHLSLSPLLRCSLSTQPLQQQQEEEEVPSLAHYLISSLGFSPEQAFKVSATKRLQAMKSPSQVESVITFLKEVGLSDHQVKKLISMCPNILGSKVKKTLMPRVRELMDGGFAGDELAELIEYNPVCLFRRGTLSRLQFWRNFVGGNDQVLLKVMRRNRFLIIADIDEHVVPRLNLLKEYGLSDEDILNLLIKGQACFLRSLEALKKILEKTEQLGFCPGSSMFICGLRVVSLYNRETLQEKEDFFKVMFGWSDEELSIAVKKYPYILTLSKENIRSKMEFLVKKAGFEPRSIASMPTLLTFSLSRLAARHNVLRSLEAKGLKKNCNLLNACVLSEKRFLDCYVAPYNKELSGLDETYIDAYLEKVPS